MDAGRKWLGFSVSIEIDTSMVFVWVVGIDLISVCWINLTRFEFKDGIWLVLCAGVENDLVLVSRSKLIYILCDNVRPQIGMES